MIRIQEFRLHPRDSFDGRRMRFLFQLFDNELIIGASVINVIVTGSIFPDWLKQLPLNSTETDLGKLVLMIIEDDLRDILRNNYTIENPIDLRYWTGNNPRIIYDISNVEEINGYEITL